MRLSYNVSFMHGSFLLLCRSLSSVKNAAGDLEELVKDKSIITNQGRIEATMNVR